MKNKNTLYGILFYGIIALLAIYFLFFRYNRTFSNGDSITPIPTEDFSVPTTSSNQQPVYQYAPITQSYLYCWNRGNPAPHHLGHPVYGDHLCPTGCATRLQQ